MNIKSESDSDEDIDALSIEYEDITDLSALSSQPHAAHAAPIPRITQVISTKDLHLNTPSKEEKEDAEYQFDNEIKSCTENDHHAICLSYLNLYLKSKLSCSTSIKSLKKYLLTLQLLPQSLNVQCKTLYENDRLPQLCQLLETIPKDQWRNCMRQISFNKKLYPLRIPAEELDFPLSNIALMASSVIHPDVIELMCQVHGPLPPHNGQNIIDDEVASDYRTNLWHTIRLKINELAPSIQNNYTSKFSQLSILNPSTGRFADDDSLKKLFLRWKSRVHAFYRKFHHRSHQTSGFEFELEVYNTVLRSERIRDLAIFYCWKEWYPHMNKYCWLSTSSSRSSENGAILSSSTKRKRNPHPIENIFNEEYFKKLKTVFINEELDNLVIEEYKSKILLSKIQRIEEILQNKFHLYPPEVIEKYKNKLMELDEEFLA